MTRLVRPDAQGLMASTAITAPTTSAIAPSPEIASAEISRISRAVDGGVMAAEPAGDDPATAGAIIAAVGCSVVGRRSAIAAAGLPPPHQHVANKRRRADSNSKCHHLVRHRLLLAYRWMAPNCAPQKSVKWPMFVAECGHPVH